MCALCTVTFCKVSNGIRPVWLDVTIKKFIIYFFGYLISVQKHTGSFMSPCGNSISRENCHILDFDLDTSSITRQIISKNPTGQSGAEAEAFSSFSAWCLSEVSPLSLFWSASSILSSFSLTKIKRYLKIKRKQEQIMLKLFSLGHSKWGLLTFPFRERRENCLDFCLSKYSHEESQVKSFHKTCSSHAENLGHPKVVVGFQKPQKSLWLLEGISPHINK